MVCIQEESGELEKQLATERGRSRLVQQDLAATLQESKEALHREQDIMAQLEAQDQVPISSPHTPLPPCPLLHPPWLWSCLWSATQLQTPPAH